MKQGFFSRFFLVPIKDGDYDPFWTCVVWTFNCSVEDYYVPDLSGRLVCHCRPEGCLFSHAGRLEAQEVPSAYFWRKGLSVQGSSLWPGLGVEDIHKVHGCCSGPFEAPGHSCTQLPERLPHTSLLQGVSELSQRYHPPPHLASELVLRRNTKKTVLTASRQTVFLGVHLDSVQMQARLAPAQISSFNACSYAVWFVNGPGRAAFLAWRVWYIIPKACKLYAASSEPMKENVSGYSRNPCFLNRERNAAFAAKLLAAEKSEEQMARSSV